jgi:hypothetical protein
MNMPSLFESSVQAILARVVIGVTGHRVLDDIPALTEQVRRTVEVNDQPVLIADGYHKLTMAYNNRGKLIEEALFEVDGQPVPRVGGYVRLEWEYDSSGKVISEVGYLANGLAMLIR